MWECGCEGGAEEQHPKRKWLVKQRQTALRSFTPPFGFVVSAMAMVLWLFRIFF